MPWHLLGGSDSTLALLFTVLCCAVGLWLLVTRGGSAARARRMSLPAGEGDSIGGKRPGTRDHTRRIHTSNASLRLLPA